MMYLSKNSNFYYFDGCNKTLILILEIIFIFKTLTSFNIFLPLNKSTYLDLELLPSCFFIIILFFYKFNSTSLFKSMIILVFSLFLLPILIFDCFSIFLIFSIDHYKKNNFNGQLLRP